MSSYLARIGTPGVKPIKLKSLKLHKNIHLSVTDLTFK